MENNITPFWHEQFGEIRVTDQNEQPWFVLKDICKSLEIGNPSQAASYLDDDEKDGIITNDVTNRKQEMIIVSESGLYSLILRSRKPEAKTFKRWVTHEILPAIRAKGGYIVSKSDDTPEAILARAVLVARDTIDRMKQQAEADRPKVVFADAVDASTTSILIGDLAKLLRQNSVEIGQNRLFNWMRENGYLMKHGERRNMPTQRAMEMGLFEIKERTINNPDGSIRITKTTKATGRGQIHFINAFKGSKCAPVSA